MPKTIAKRIVSKKKSFGQKAVSKKTDSTPPVIETQTSYLARFHFLGRDNIARLRKAYGLSEVGHKNQVRDTGETYFTHPRAVSIMIFDLGIKDVDVHIAALCHDLVEDTVITYNQIRNHFGQRVADIVKTVSIPSKTNGSFVTQDKYEAYFEQLAKGTPEAQLVALADNLHNVQTLSYCSYEKQQRFLFRARTFYIPTINVIAKKYPHTKKMKGMYKKAMSM